MPQKEIRKQQKGTGPKRSHHRASECGKWGRAEHNQRTFGSADSERCFKSATALHFSAALIDNTTSLKIEQCVKEKVRLLVDTGSDVNMIKLSELKKNILVDETTIYKLTGINSQPVFTIGSVTLKIQLGTEDTIAVFQVTHDNFPISEAGILGAPFLRDNGININFRTSTLSTESPNPEPPEPQIIQPRSETLIPVLTDKEDGTTLIIHAQNIGEKGIVSGNIVNHVKDGQILVSVINTSEDPIELFPPRLGGVQHEIFRESGAYVCHQIEEQKVKESRKKRLTETIRMDHLNHEERASLLRICKKYQDLFHFEGEPLSFTTAIQHEIKIPEGTAPVNIRPYRLPYAHRQVIVEQMEKLEEDNIIQPSESPWNAPLVVVPKKPDANGKPQFRVCVDFRRLNQLIIGDAFPIPRIDEILDQLGRSRYYTTLDLASGYHQVPIRPQDCEKTGFSTDKGHFEFVRMPFGLCGAPSTFQRLMNNVLTGLNGMKAFVYLDDIIIHAVDLMEHETRLEEVFQRLRKFNLQLQPNKCQFLRREVIYLGHLITDAGVRPDPTKISCVRDHPVPRNPTEIKQFLGLSGYKYQDIMSLYEATAKICGQMTERFGSTEISNACEQFVQVFSRATLPYLYEIETSHRNMLLSIGDKYTGEARIRRGLVHTVQRMVKVLYGMYSNIDTDFIFKQIIALSLSRNQNITLSSERIRIMQVDTDKQIKKITEHQEKLEENLQYLQEQTRVVIQKLDKIEFKTRLLEQAFLFEILLNQYSYETQNLMAVINSAMNGEIHTSVFSSEKFLMELREIKMNLPVGTALPLELKAESLTEFLQISDLTILHREHYLVFLIGIPLTSVEEYTMYHPISLPIQYGENTIALIPPEIDYLALSNDNENFISLGVSQWESCSKLESYTLCKGEQPIHYRTGSNLCELSQLTKFNTHSKDCRVKLVTLETPIWHRLSKTNSWLYYTQPDLCTIKCTDPPHTFRVEISGVGRLTTSSSCEIHTKSSILVPFSKSNRNIKLDIIPENRKSNIKSMLTETFCSVMPQNLTNVKIFKDFNSLAHRAMESSELKPKPTEPLFIFKIEFHITMLYISITFSILFISAVAIRFKNKIIKMYNPEIADNLSNNNQDNL
ncbi:uncharacterized protein LOC113558051 [Rhopalosiphum maidis]|uniref:uncharacterized protein LOC113558051 n=1 Tax=Rhopalosiphum maidis TaxID=43146 RepID=UPI000EFF9E3E|nr:uncharacterized protein LOC113558051 [Rhopalosiphum maidis]